MARPARRFLGFGARAGDGLGYLTQPQRPLENTLEPDPPEVVELIAGATRLCDEPECDSEALADYAATAEFWRTQKHAAEVLAARQLRPLLKAEARLVDAQRRAKQAHRKDLSGEFLALKHMLAHDRKGGGNPSASTLARLERVETRLDGLDQAA